MIQLSETSSYNFYDDPLRMYNAMLDDIEQAKYYIDLETYKFGNDQIGIKFRDALTKKARQGVKVRILIDSWGAYVSQSFFSELLKHGGELRFFKKLRLNFDSFTKSHRRNHRKLLLIDDRITYISSANIAAYALNWRESSLRLESKITAVFRESFNDSYRIYNKYIYDKLGLSKSLFFENFEILRGVPATVLQPARKKFLELIRAAKKEIIIETPYFLPGGYMRRALMEAALRGVSVKVFMPQHSDVNIVDLLRNRYLGEMQKNNVEILFYTPRNLHCKIFVADRSAFVIGSSNFDYRSFRYMHEIDLYGKDKNIIALLMAHIRETANECIPFDNKKWRERSLFQRIFERILIPFRHFL